MRIVVAAVVGLAAVAVLVLTAWLAGWQVS